LLKNSNQIKLIEILHHRDNLKNIKDDEITALYKSIGKKVKNLRKERGISQLDLALSIGFKSVSSIAKAELLVENKHFNIEQLYKISKVLNVEMRYFFE
jgi:ribosome-binding protein aMBF1 (putative translation factor)